MSIFNTFRSEIESLFDIKKLTKVNGFIVQKLSRLTSHCQIAFQDLNPFPLRVIRSKRDHHNRILKVGQELIKH